MLAGIIYVSTGKVLLLSVGRTGPRLPVKRGDIISLRYIQSMYGVPVEEKMRVENGYLVLFEVISSGAALEYLGIDKHGMDNIYRVLQGFSIPGNSVGNHILVLADREIPLLAIDGRDTSVSIGLTMMNRLEYYLGKRYEK